MQLRHRNRSRRRPAAGLFTGVQRCTVLQQLKTRRKFNLTRSPTVKSMCPGVCVFVTCAGHARVTGLSCFCFHTACCFLVSPLRSLRLYTLRSLVHGHKTYSLCGFVVHTRFLQKAFAVLVLHTVVTGALRWRPLAPSYANIQQRWVDLLMHAALVSMRHSRCILPDVKNVRSFRGVVF